MTLFDEFDRKNVDYKNHKESTYDFYNRVAMDKFAVIRVMLEKWFANYPDKNKKKLKSDFIKNGFDAAFFELYLYEYFSKLGFNIEIEPDMVNTTNRPDFLISNESFSFYLEATIIKDISEKEHKKEKIKGEVYDIINLLYSPNFYLNINVFELISGNQPSTKKLVKFIQDRLASVEPDEIKRIVKDKDFDLVPRWIYEDKDMFMEFELIPKSVENKSNEKSATIGMYGSNGRIKIDGIVGTIKNSLSYKASRYGNFDKPYLIAINFISLLDDLDVDFALFGSESILISTEMREIIKTIRNRDGFFYGKNGFQHKRVSGIIVGNIYPSNAQCSRLTLYHNPKANNPFLRQNLPVKHVYLEKDKQSNYYVKKVDEN